jgi:hypothetical protein
MNSGSGGTTERPTHSTITTTTEQEMNKKHRETLLTKIIFLD